MTDIWGPAPTTQSSSPGVTREPFTFTGNTRDYFGIWIVNVLLTIVTLGVYSAWAKVRRQRYFYGNTWLAGSSFEYHAKPIKILVGLDMRGVVAGVIVADHHEPYGYFSVDTPEFATQFKGKSVRDEFRVGKDVQAISRATLTVTSATRAIRNSSRRIATALIPPPR